MVDRTASNGVDRRLASCSDEAIATSLFFSDLIADIATAKAVCGTCPEIDACLDGALARREPYGVWGGQLFANGIVIANKRPRGRPRKHPIVAIPA